ncbi:MAG: hypothetical protein GAK45_00078 [Pseudomonas citronellolis]|nr:MAG: hypothetical protein GAK45_00078 [Pseudomonas citronellolis]
MRRLMIALMLLLPLSGCVVYEHDHGWRGPRYYGPPPPPRYAPAPPPGPGYYWHR